MARRKQQSTGFIRGHATHRRTEGDYMAALLDTVTLEDWREVVAGALNAAKAGDAPARAWLAQYLVGKPAGSAPTPLTVVVQQLSGSDAVVNRLAKAEIDRARFPSRHQGDDLDNSVRALIAQELAEKMRTVETTETPATARDSREAGYAPSDSVA